MYIDIITAIFMHHEQLGFKHKVTLIGFILNWAAISEPRKRQHLSYRLTGFFLYPLF